MIPIVDLRAQHLEIKDEVDPALIKIFTDSHFILGPNVNEFEKEMADFCQAKFAIGVASGTDALHLALRALDIGPGDEDLVIAGRQVVERPVGRAGGYLVRNKVAAVEAVGVDFCEVACG